MSDDVYIREDEMALKFEGADWKRRETYRYIDSLIDTVRASSVQLVKNHVDFDICSMAHADYIVMHYKKLRRKLVDENWERGSPYPSWVPAHYVWKDSHMALAWEFLRRSTKYQSYINRLSHQIDDCFSIISEYAILCVDSGCVETARSLYSDGNKIKAWRLLNNIIESKMIIKIINREIINSIVLVRSFEDRIRDIFRMDFDSCVGFSHSTSPPVFVGPSRKIKILARKENWMQPVVWSNDVSIDDGDVVVAINKDQDINHQLAQLKEILSKNLIDEESKDSKYYRERRPQIEKFVDYLRICDALNESTATIKEISDVIYGKSASDVKRLEKAIHAAGVWADSHYYIAIQKPKRK